MPFSGFSPFQELGAGNDAIAAGSWMLDGGEVGDRSSLPGWNYATKLRFSRHVALELKAVRAACGLDETSILRLTVAWTAHAAVNTGAVAASVDVPLGGDGRVERDISLNIPSDHLAVQLEISTVLALHRRGSRSSALAARDPGSVLWRDDVTLTLEGTRPRLSILPIDFSARFQSRESGAAWYVSTTAGWLFQHPSVGITVYVNSGRPGLLAALQARNGGPQPSFVQSVLMHDVGRTLIERALADNEFTDESSFGRGNAGSSLRATLRSLFNGDSIFQIRALQEHSPDVFDRVMQTRHRLLDAMQ